MLDWTMTTPAPEPSTRSAAGSAAGNAAAGPDARLAALTASLATRLRTVCRGWDGAEFDALVERIARTQLRWRDRGDGD